MKPIAKSPILLALGAAVLFGASAPLSKLLLGETDPIILAALLYLGSGFSALIFKSFRLVVEKDGSAEASLTHQDLPWLAGAVISGGILGPILLMTGLKSTPAATASLLLNFESTATVLIAGFIFRESIDRHVWWAMALITAAGILLSLNLQGEWGLSLGALAVIGACFSWGVDNNLTRHVSAKDPFSIVAIKGLGAGSFSLLLGFALGQSLPSLGTIFLAMLVGSLCYGASIALFVLSMRHLGSARTGTWYAIAPFVGSALAVVLLREYPSILFFISLPLMILGVVLMLNETHAHPHAHEWLEHEHRHSHPEPHHEHAHAWAVAPGVAHSHWHTHSPIAHEHPHHPDLHHSH